jgi:tRNA(fMet)-specific endonuclease VapC
MAYLLDTNVVSDLVRHPQGQVASRIAQTGDEKVSTSIVVAAELRYSARRKNSPRLTAQVEAVFGALEILPLDAPADRVYAEIRAQLEKSGRPIGANNMLIAAQSLALDCTLVTDNGREFSRIKKLKIENWVR